MKAKVLEPKKPVAKPLTVAYAETQGAIVDVINKSGLPACFLVPLFENFTNQLRGIADQQLSNDSQAYEEANKPVSEEDGEVE